MISESRRNKKNIKDFLKFNEHEGTTFPNLWHTMKAVLRGTFIALTDVVKKLKRSNTSDLKVHLEQKRSIVPERIK